MEWVAIVQSANKGYQAADKGNANEGLRELQKGHGADNYR
jgi:hypothetical protein